MNLSESLTEASQYTGAIFQRIGELLMLFIVSIIPIVNFISFGYYARVIRDAPSSKAPPKLENYVDMFVEGLKIFVVVIIWAIIVGIIAVIIGIPFLALAIPLAALTDPSFWTTPAAFYTLAPFIAVVAVVGFFLGIIAFMGIVNMMKKGSFGKAFAFGEISHIIGNIGWSRYLAFFVIAFGVSAIIGSVAGALLTLGWVISAVLNVLAGIFFSRTIGLMYDQTMQPSTQLPPTQTATSPT
jgi:hypothetical protein